MQASPTLKKTAEALKSLKENIFSPKPADASKSFCCHPLQASKSALY
jgi:hypothetical protein